MLAFCNGAPRTGTEVSMWVHAVYSTRDNKICRFEEWEGANKLRK